MCVACVSHRRTSGSSVCVIYRTSGTYCDRRENYVMTRGRVRGRRREVLGSRATDDPPSRAAPRVARPHAAGTHGATRTVDAFTAVSTTRARRTTAHEGSCTRCRARRRCACPPRGGGRSAPSARCRARGRSGRGWICLPRCRSRASARRSSRARRSARRRTRTPIVRVWLHSSSARRRSR